MGGSRSKQLLRRIRVLAMKQQGRSSLKNGPSSQLREFLDMLGTADADHLLRLRELALSSPIA